jgi:hypothetical protein
MSGYRSGGGFAEGFQGGWGLADSYLNRQEDRKRQKFEDARREEETKYQRTQDGLVRQDRLDAATQVQSNYVAEQERLADQTAIQNASTSLRDSKVSLELQALKSKQALDKKRREATELLSEGQKAGHFHYGGPAKQQVIFNPKSPGAYKWANKMGVSVDPDGSMGKHVTDINLLKETFTTGRVTPKALEAFNRIANPLLNRRGGTVTHSKIVERNGPNGPESIDVKGWKIVNREVSRVIPTNKGSNFAFDMVVTVEDPATGAIAQYRAPSTVGGDNDPNAEVQQFTPEQIMSYVGQQEESLKAMVGDPSMIGKFAPSVLMAMGGDNGKAMEQRAKWALKATEEKNRAKEQSVKEANRALEAQLKTAAKTAKFTKEALATKLKIMNAEAKIPGILEKNRRESRKFYSDYAKEVLGPLVDSKGYDNKLRQSFNSSWDKWVPKLAKTFGVANNDLHSHSKTYDVYQQAMVAARQQFRRLGTQSYANDSVLDAYFLTYFSEEDPTVVEAPPPPPPGVEPPPAKPYKRKGIEWRGVDELEMLKLRRGNTDVHNSTKNLMSPR